jgi:hypothetical protein
MLLHGVLFRGDKAGETDGAADVPRAGSSAATG